MILSFSGDPFLSHRAARRALQARGFRPEEIQELAEGMQADEVAQLAAQSGLFGQVALLLDFDVAFKGQAGVKPRNAVIKALEPSQSSDNVVVIVDSEATASRQKTYQQLGEHETLATPRFGALNHWIKQELQQAKLRFDPDVPETLADLFGEDLPSIAAEIYKFVVLEEKLSSERVRHIVNRPAARSAFDLIEACAKGDAKTALSICHSLMNQGEAPAKILGALTWQYNLVARCVGLQDKHQRLDAGTVTRSLRTSPYVAKKALALAKPLDEARLEHILRLILKADMAIKSGKDERWALESLAISLSQQSR